MYTYTCTHPYVGNHAARSALLVLLSLGLYVCIYMYRNYRYVSRWTQDYRYICTHTYVYVYMYVYICTQTTMGVHKCSPRSESSADEVTRDVASVIAEACTQGVGG